MNVLRYYTRDLKTLAHIHYPPTTLKAVGASSQHLGKKTSMRNVAYKFSTHSGKRTRGCLSFTLLTTYSRFITGCLYTNRPNRKSY